MRYLMMLLLLLSTDALASNWMGETDMASARNGTPGYQVYTSQGGCQTQESEPCYQIDGKSPITHLVKQVREGPFEAATNIEDCADEADCLSKVQDPVAKCGDPSYMALWGDLDGDSSRDADGVSLMDDLEAWCTRRLLVNRLKHDDALQAAKDAADAAQATEAGIRAAKRVQREIDAVVCVAAVNAGGNLTAPDLKNCVAALVKEVYEKSIAVPDL